MPRRRSGMAFDEGTRGAVQIVVFLTAILTGSAALATQYGQLPWWLKYLVVLFTSVSVVVLVTQFLWPPLSDWSSGLRERWRLNAISRTVLPEFQDIVRRFQELISVQNQDTLPTFFWNLRAQEPSWRIKLPAIPQLLFMSELFTVFLRSLREEDRTYGKLKELAADFFLFLHQYDSVYVFEPLNTLRAIGKDEVPEHLRHKVNLLRENYVMFVRDYMSFAKRANARLGSSPFVEHVRLPEPV